MVTEIDWDVLRDKARSMIGRAYAPYSRYPVGAAGITAEGGVVAGCNVENVSYGLGICAEVALVAALVNDGGGALRSASATPAGRF